MLASQDIINTWMKFDDFPMETLTKAWFYHTDSVTKQRDVSLIKEHRHQFGLSGNCFDLALLLLDAFKKDGITAYPIGHNLSTPHAHVAVIALDELGNRFLCDLGDQWLRPILIDTHTQEYTDEKLHGFFPAATIQVKPNECGIEILYHRPNGKISKQVFDTKPIEMSYFMQAAEFSQNFIKPRPLLECRTPFKTEIAHWEFYNWESFLSTSEGLFNEPKLQSIEDWAEKINDKTGYDKQFLVNVLKSYKEFSTLES